MTIKEHIKNHKEAYIIGALSFAGITTLIMRGVAKQHIGTGISVTAGRSNNIVVAADRSVVHNVSYILSRRKGSPSWVVRCIETGEIFSSQRKAAFSMGIHENELSQHLRGLKAKAGSNTFERICMAA
jgi:hypothetical protein